LNFARPHFLFSIKEEENFLSAFCFGGGWRREKTVKRLSAIFF